MCVCVCVCGGGGGFIVRYCQFSEDCWSLSGRMIGSYPVGKDLEGSGHGLIEALSRNLWRG